MALLELKRKSKPNYGVFNQSFFSRTNKHKGILIKGWKNCEGWFNALGLSFFIWVSSTCYQSNRKNELRQNRISLFSFVSNLKYDTTICWRVLRLWKGGYKLKDSISHLTFLHRADRYKRWAWSKMHVSVKTRKQKNQKGMRGGSQNIKSCMLNV